MKIVDVCGFYSETGGGVRSYVRQKFDAAHRAGHDLTVIAPGAENKVEARRGGRVRWIASPPMPFDANYRVFRDQAAVWRALDAVSPDIIEGSSPWGSGRMAGRWPGHAARALIFHQDFVAGYPRAALDRWLSGPTIDTLFYPYWRRVRRLSERFDVTVAGGDWLARRLVGFGVGNAVAVPFGVEDGPFSPVRRDAALRNDLLARCGVAPSGRLLLAVGRFHPEKRHRTIIEAFVLARKTRPDFGLVLAGDGLTRKTVERLARRAGDTLRQRRRPGAWIGRRNLWPGCGRSHGVGPTGHRSGHRRRGRSGGARAFAEVQDRRRQVLRVGHSRSVHRAARRVARFVRAGPLGRALRTALRPL